MSILLHILAFMAGLLLVAYTLLSAIRTFVLPRSAADMLTNILFLGVRFLFDRVVRRLPTYAQKDRILAFYAPVTLLALLPFWLALVTLGFAGMYWGTGTMSGADAYLLSGSSLLTLGFFRGDSLLHNTMAFIEATIGLILVALLIAYLPTMYNAFSERERSVLLLESYAGAPPSAVELILRVNRNRLLHQLDDFWEKWSEWFAAIAESHTSLSALVFFRSPQPDHSWVNAAGAVLDAGALYLAVLDIPWNARIALCLRSGYLALRAIADFFQLAYNVDPHFPEDPIAVSRAEFDEVYDLFASAGVPVKADRELAWLDFAGWRVNYDAVLLALAALTQAPPARWSAERRLAFDGKRKRLLRARS